MSSCDRFCLEDRAIEQAVYVMKLRYNSLRIRTGYNALLRNRMRKAEVLPIEQPWTVSEGCSIICVLE